MLWLLAILAVDPPLSGVSIPPKPTLTARAVVVEVTDADTVVLDAQIWHDLTHRVRLRIKGIDAPELSTEAGQKAHKWAKANLPVGAAVTVVSTGYDKFGGRDLGDIRYDSGDLYSAAIVKYGHAKKWDGKGLKPKAVLAVEAPQATPAGPGTNIIIAQPATGGGPVKKVGRWVKQCLGTHCAMVWVEE